MDPQSKKQLIISLVTIRGGQFCAYCNRHMTFREITLDHIVPIGHGGTWDLSNLCLCCWDCNNERGNNHTIMPLYREHGPKNDTKITMTNIGKSLEVAIGKNPEFSKNVKKNGHGPKPELPRVSTTPMYSVAEKWPSKKRP